MGKKIIVNCSNDLSLCILKASSYSDSDIDSIRCYSNTGGQKNVYNIYYIYNVHTRGQGLPQCGLPIVITEGVDVASYPRGLINSNQSQISNNKSRRSYHVSSSRHIIV